jgi:hypothetical protein
MEANAENTGKPATFRRRRRPRRVYVPPYDPECAEHLPAQLRDARWVYRHDERRFDTTPGRQMYRELMETKPTWFFKHLMSLEADYQKSLRLAAARAERNRYGRR